ncbi:6169_t:CDS:1, partial [Gigaspora rosea]
MPENSLKGIQGQIPKTKPQKKLYTAKNAESAQREFTAQRRKCPRTCPENSLYNVKSAQGQAPENSSHNVECTQEQAPESSHAMPNVPKDKYLKIHTTERAQGQALKKIHNTETPAI